MLRYSAPQGSFKYTARGLGIIANRVYKAFVVGGGTTHSATASTLPLLLNRLEADRIPYTLTAHPGKGYIVERIDE